MKTYSDLAAFLHELGVLDSIGSVLGWDEQVMLPPGGMEYRSEQASTISRLCHERILDPRTREMIEDVEAADLDEDQRVVVRELRRDFDRSIKMPTALVVELSKTSVLSQSAWVDARAARDFSAFAPWLEKMMALKRQQAACYGSASGDPYDALLDTYEPGETAASLRPVFASLTPQLIKLLGKVRGSSRRAPTEVLHRHFPIEPQRTITLAIAKAIGFDSNAGRLDVSVHPFCTGIGPGDTRITTRYSESDFTGALLGTLHETGHAMYEQGLPKATWSGTALAEAASLGIHESQSRLWENQVGRGRSFWTHFWPGMCDAFGLSDIPLEKWLFAINAIEPTFIRTEADELTYNVHVALRFDLEHALVNGDLAVADVPAAWDARMLSDFGLTVPDQSMGCLQDVHWSAGLIGYFPTYTLGNLYAAELFDTFSAAHPNCQDDFARGDFSGLLKWLRENVHRHGRRYRARELCQRVTGKPRSADALVRRLTQKVSNYYGV